MDAIPGSCWNGLGTFPIKEDGQAVEPYGRSGGVGMHNLTSRVFAGVGEARARLMLVVRPLPARFSGQRQEIFWRWQGW